MAPDSLNHPQVILAGKQEGAMEQLAEVYDFKPEQKQEASEALRKVGEYKAELDRLKAEMKDLNDELPSIEAGKNVEDNSEPINAAELRKYITEIYAIVLGMEKLDQESQEPSKVSNIVVQKIKNVLGWLKDFYDDCQPGGHHGEHTARVDIALAAVDAEEDGGGALETHKRKIAITDLELEVANKKWMRAHEELREVMPESIPTQMNHGTLKKIAIELNNPTVQTAEELREVQKTIQKLQQTRWDLLNAAVLASASTLMVSEYLSSDAPWPQKLLILSAIAAVGMGGAFASLSSWNEKHFGDLDELNITDYDIGRTESSKEKTE